MILCETNKLTKYNAIKKFKCPKLGLNPIPLDPQAIALPVEPNRKPRLHYLTNTFVVYVAISKSLSDNQCKF